MKLDDILSKLQNVKPLQNGEYQAICPAHDDKKASLSLTEKNGKILIHCQAGCTIESVIGSLGIEKKDLFLAEKRDYVLAIYRYKDMKGKPYEVVRSFPKEFYQRQEDGHGGYIKNLNGIVKNLYRIDEIDKTKPVFICEGEKDCDRLFSEGLQATTNCGGAGKWIDSYSDLLNNCEIVIIPDNDVTGQNHAKQIIASMKEKAKSIKLLELPDLPPKGDVSDYLNKNKIENLLILVQNCNEYKEQEEIYWLPDLVLREISEPEKKLLFKTGFKRLDDIVEFKEGRFIVISGLPGYGKTSFCYNLLIKAAQDNICLFQNLEMDTEETYCRLAAILENKTIYQIKDYGNSENKSAWKVNWSPLLMLNNIFMDFDKNYTMESIDRLCQKVFPKVLFIDNNKLLNTEVETQSDIRHFEMIAKMCKQLAKNRKLCVVLVAHTRKDTLEKEPGLSDIYGASAFAQLADAVIFLHPRNKDEKRALNLKVAKNRQGKTDIIPIYYEEEKTRFTEVTR